MATNILISSDEERRINDILEKGINEIKAPMERHNHNLKSSIISKGENSNSAGTNSIIDNNLNLNYNYSTDNKEIVTSLNNNIHEYNNKFLGKNFNYPNNTNKESNLSLNINNAKSSALRNLLDEMKMNNKLFSSSEDEYDYNRKFTGNYGRTNNHNIRDSSNTNNDNFKVDINKIDLMKTNTLSSERLLDKQSPVRDYNQQYQHEHDGCYEQNKTELNNSKKQTDLNFNDVKSDMKNLQGKIEGLEEKLSGM